MTLYRKICLCLLIVLAADLTLRAENPDSTAVEEAKPAVDSVQNKSLGAGINGGLQLSNVFYFTSLDSAYRSPFSYVLAGNFNLTWKNISLPFSFVLSEQERSFRQPLISLGQVRNTNG